MRHAEGPLGDVPKKRKERKERRREEGERLPRSVVAPGWCCGFVRK